MWYTIEYKTKTQRKYRFHSMTGCTTLVATLKAELEALGYDVNITEGEIA